MGSEWSSTTLGALALASDGVVDGPFGSNLPASSYTDSGVPVIRGSNLSIGLNDFKDEGFVFIPQDVFNKLSRSACIVNDIIFTKKGTLGQTGMLTKHCKYSTYLLSSNQMRLRVDLTKAVPEYVYYCVSSKESITKLIKDSESTGVPKINLGYLKSFPIKLPNLREQEKIVGVLKSINSKIALNLQINQTLEQMAQALFKSWFVDFDPVIDNALDAGNPIPDALAERAARRQAARASDDFQPLPNDVRQLFPNEFEESELGWIPKGWGISKFEDILIHTIGGDWGKDQPDEKHTIQACIIRGTDIPELALGNKSNAPTRWVEEKKLKTRQLKHGDIVIEVSGGSPTQSTGRSLLITDDVLKRIGGIAEPASFCRLFRPSTKELGLFGAMHLKRIYDAGKMWEYQNQSTGIANFQTKYFLGAELIVLPTPSILEELYQMVMPWIKKAQNGESLMLEKLRDTLLPKLISGELRLDSPEVKKATSLIDIE
jgi:type I restriction enzyme S subunit